MMTFGGMRNHLEGTLGSASNGHRHPSERNETASFHAHSNSRSQSGQQDIIQEESTPPNPFALQVAPSDPADNIFAANSDSIQHPWRVKQ